MNEKGKLVLHMASALELEGFLPVYLRNYENLPEDVGNDVDLLIRPGNTRTAESLLIASAKQHGWDHLRTIQFGPSSVFFTNKDGNDFLHVDLFTKLEWHFLCFARPSDIIARRRPHQLVSVPDPSDEVFLNLCTRLYYQGVIRPKHRMQASMLLEQEDSERFRDIVKHHIGETAADLIVRKTLAEKWAELESSHKKCRRLLALHALTRRPLTHISSLFGYAYRSLGRILAPPGPFIVFEGADGVGKSSVIDGCIPFLRAMTGKSNDVVFHWKPTSRSIRRAGEPAAAANDPRAGQLRSHPQSFLFLCYHWLAFWAGYFRFVLPARAKNRAVIGDRYSYEFVLDPERLRLKLPLWLRYVASITTPKPDLVIGLVASPDAILSRKQELSMDEIQRYQDALESLSQKHSYFKIMDAGGTLSDTIASTRKSIINHYINPS